MKFSIRYVSDYRYDQAVADNLNALRVRPATTASQTVESFDLRTDPEARLQRHTDYFGTEVIEFGVATPHEHLTIDARARVSTVAPAEPPEASWSALDARAYRDTGAEFLLEGEDAPGNGQVGELTERVRARSPLASLLLLSELIPDSFEYRQGATYVDSTIDDLLEAGAGVCQDFVHLGLLLCRRMGLAARYVSGYLYVEDAAGGGDSVEVDTHAWLEALVPQAGGGGEPVWVGADPTNRGLTGERHVKIGHGRHYADVPPIKGVYQGSATAEVSARVEMRTLP